MVKPIVIEYCSKCRKNQRSWFSTLGRLAIFHCIACLTQKAYLPPLAQIIQ